MYLQNKIIQRVSLKTIVSFFPYEISIVEERKPSKAVQPHKIGKYSVKWDFVHL